MLRQSGTAATQMPRRWRMRHGACGLNYFLHDGASVPEFPLDGKMVFARKGRVRSFAHWRKEAGEASSKAMEFTTLEAWRAEQDRINSSNDLCGLWQWLVIAICVLCKMLS